MKRKPIDFLGIFAALTTVLARNDVGNDLRKECDVHPKHWDRFLDFKEPVPTVNIVETVDDKVVGVTSFLDNPEGNHAAVAHFKALVKEHNKGVHLFDAEILNALVEDGTYDDEQGYVITLTHSQV